MKDETKEQLPCVEKLVFDTQVQAKAAATVAEYQHGTKLKAYHCHYCHLWHLASNY
jgi:hypothetical protein